MHNVRTTNSVVVCCSGVRGERSIPKNDYNIILYSAYLRIMIIVYILYEYGPQYNTYYFGPPCPREKILLWHHIADTPTLWSFFLLSLVLLNKCNNYVVRLMISSTHSFILHRWRKSCRKFNVIYYFDDSYKAVINNYRRELLFITYRFPSTTFLNLKFLLVDTTVVLPHHRYFYVFGERLLKYLLAAQSYIHIWCFYCSGIK